MYTTVTFNAGHKIKLHPESTHVWVFEGGLRWFTLSDIRDETSNELTS